MGISGTMNHLKQLRCGAFEDAVLQFADEGLVFSSESFVVGQKKYGHVDEGESCLQL